LNVPSTRLQKTDGFNLGRSSEITRDEIKFTKFVQRIRKKFAHLFLEALKIQLVLKGVINIDDWDNMVQDIRFDYLRDNHFSELKEAEIMQGRLNILATMDPFVGKYYSPTYVKKNILKLTDEEIQEIDKENIDHNNDMLANELQKQQLQGDVQNEIQKGAPQ
jgi:hypothetical protein